MKIIFMLLLAIVLGLMLDSLIYNRMKSVVKEGLKEYFEEKE